MKKRLLIPMLFIGILFSSCVEIIDDLSFNLNGSGSLKYSINLSSSKVKLNSILALDSLDGTKIPTREEIEVKIEEFKHKVLTWEGNEIVRSIPEIIVNQAKKLKAEDIELLKQGNYTSITRFQKEIEKFDNPKAMLSKNKMAVMVKTDPYSLINNAELLNNRIYLTK